jgi:hypothetical protein
VCTELKNRGVEDVLMAVCDGLTGLPDAINTVWPKTVVQTCVVHLLRNSFKYAGRQHWDAISKALKPVYTAPTEAAAEQRFLEFAETWGEKYPAIVRLWENAWAAFVPFLAFDVEIRKVVCSTNAIESVNARIRIRTSPNGWHLAARPTHPAGSCNTAAWPATTNATRRLRGPPRWAAINGMLRRITRTPSTTPIPPRFHPHLTPISNTHAAGIRPSYARPVSRSSCSSRRKKCCTSRCESVAGELAGRGSTRS